MRWKIASLWVCALALAGCNKGINEPADRGAFPVKSSGEGITIVDVTRDQIHREITARVVGDNTNGVLRITPSNDAPFSEGITAELSDASGAPLFTISTGWDADGTQFWIRESTPTDYLIMSMTGYDERVREEYDANGDVAAFDYPMLPYETLRKAANFYEHGVPTSGLPASVGEFVDRLGEFDAYYAPHAASTLHANPDGELLVRILTEPGFVQFALGAETPDPNRNRAAQICSAAWLCARLKCLAGGLSNPVCIACSGTSLACSIAMFACAWFVNCN